MNELKQVLYLLENKLLTPKVRSSPDEIEKLLSDNFIEFCSSGSIYKYKLGDSFKDNDKIKLNWNIENFIINKLSEECYLATYTLTKLSPYHKSLRSSVWKKINGDWKMVFHQGTIVNK